REVLPRNARAIWQVIVRNNVSLRSVRREMSWLSAFDGGFTAPVVSLLGHEPIHSLGRPAKPPAVRSDVGHPGLLRGDDRRALAPLASIRSAGRSARGRAHSR